jgi:hypothetical protein
MCAAGHRFRDSRQWPQRPRVNASRAVKGRHQPRSLFFSCAGETSTVTRYFDANEAAVSRCRNKKRNAAGTDRERVTVADDFELMRQGIRLLLTPQAFNKFSTTIRVRVLRNCHHGIRHYFPQG